MDQEEIIDIINLRRWLIAELRWEIDNVNSEREVIRWLTAETRWENEKLSERIEQLQEKTTVAQKQNNKEIRVITNAVEKVVKMSRCPQCQGLVFFSDALCQRCGHDLGVQ